MVKTTQGINKANKPFRLHGWIQHILQIFPVHFTEKLLYDFLIEKKSSQTKLLYIKFQTNVLVSTVLIGFPESNQLGNWKLGNFTYILQIK